jgi:hypothetical protein
MKSDDPIVAISPEELAKLKETGMSFINDTMESRRFYKENGDGPFPLVLDTPQNRKDGLRKHPVCGTDGKQVNVIKIGNDLCTELAGVWQGLECVPDKGVDSNDERSANFEKELASLINSKCMENGSDTPDFLLAEYMKGCLDLFNKTVTKRTAWYSPEGLKE